MIRLLIVDDHPLILEGTRALFQNEKEICISTQINPQKVLSQMAIEKYDVYLVDVNMSLIDGLTLAKEIRGYQPQAAIILYTGDDISNYYSFVLNQQVNGVLSKTASQKELIRMVYEVMDGNIVISKHFLEFVNHQLNHAQMKMNLSKKEQQLLRYLNQGYTNKQISESLFVAQRTVERYLQQLYSHLQVSGRDEAIQKIHQEKLLENK